MKRPWIKTKCVADRYCDKNRERIIEFQGGLIGFRHQDDGTLLINLYQLDPHVRVTAPAANLIGDRS